MRSETTSTNLTFAGYARRHGLALLIDHANAKRRHGKTQVATAAQPRPFNTHHGKAAQLDHPITIQQNRRNTPSTEGSVKGSELAQTQPNLGGKIVAGREPDTHTRQAFRSGIAVDEASKHGRHANNNGGLKALGQLQRSLRVEALKKASADSRHEAVQSNTHGHDV